MSWKEDKGIAEKVTAYLFGTFDGEELKNIDFRTIIPSTEMFKTITYYRILESLGCTNAKKVANVLEGLMVSVQGVGRNQGVEILKGKQLPRTQVVLGSAENITGEE